MVFASSSVVLCIVVLLFIALLYIYIRFKKLIKNHSKVEHDILLAKEIQQYLLPQEPLRMNNFEIRFSYRPASQVLGDYLDFFRIDKSRVLLVIADASGKGVSAALLSVLCRSYINAILKNFSSLTDMLGSLNEYIFKDTSKNKFVTMTVCLIDDDRKTVEVANAGHCGFFLKNTQNVVRNIKLKGTGLGLLPSVFQVPYETNSMFLDAGESLLFLTDGLLEVDFTNKEISCKEYISDLWKKYKNNELFLKVLFESINENVIGGFELDDRTAIVLESL